QNLKHAPSTAGCLTQINAKTRGRGESGHVIRHSSSRVVAAGNAGRHLINQGATPMKNSRRLLLALALIGTAGAAQAAANCTVTLKGDDAMRFDLKEATVSAGCANITIE